MEEVAKNVQVIQATKDKNRNKLRVAVYARVSSDKEDQINSFFAQMKYYSDYIKSNEDTMMLVDIYADEGITGTELSKRDEMKRLIRDCELKRIDRVLVKSVTRFARNSLECLETVRIMTANKVSVYFENDNIDSEKMNTEMMLYIKSAFAQSEATSASRRMATSVRMKMADGTYYNVSTPYGYKWVDRKLEIVPKEAEYVKMIFDMYLSGHTVKEISESILNKSNGKEVLSTYCIRYVLSNEKYVGDMLFQKRFTPNILPFRLKKNNGEIDKYLYSNTHEAIISREIFEQVQRLRKERKSRIYKGNQKEKGFYYKKLFCRHCGWAFRNVEYKKNNSWVCAKKNNRGESCSSEIYTTECLNNSFIVLYNKLKQNKKTIIEDTINQLQSIRSKINKSDNEIANIDMEIALLCKQNSVYNEMRNNGIIDEVLFYENTDILQNRIALLRERRTKILSSDKDEYLLEELRELKRLFENNDNYLYKFDGNLFNKIISKIIAEENGDLTYVLNCGLFLTLKKEEFII